MSILLTFSLSQNSEADIGQESGRLQFHLEPGESQTLQWGMINVGEETITVLLDVKDDGSEFITFPSSVDVSPDGTTYVDVTVTIPSDYPNDVYLTPRITAIEQSDSEEPVRISLAIQQKLEIRIGNPIIPEVTAQPPPQVMEEKETEEDMKEEDMEEESTPGSFTITQSEEGGGCLISTATFGSELAPQVQMLREIRDNKLLTTGSGSTFMKGFNTLYYSFSPTIADLERQSPIFRQAVQVAITPLISSLSILNYVDMNSESEVLGYGLSLIMLNVVMYFVAPAIIISQFRRK